VTTRRAVALACLALVLVLGGCASRSAPPEAPSAGVTTTDPRAMALRTQAAHLERSGHLRLALEAWTSALALAPGHEPSRRALQRLRQRIDREVTELVRRGWEAHTQGAGSEARRLFRAALALDPDSPAAQEALRAIPAPPASDFEARI
jgi:tetratricopeptide (TPR) repeat protein